MRDQFTLSSAAAQLRSADDIVSGNMDDRFDITFFISCYNEEEFIVATLDTVQDAMMGLGLTFDIVVIDDGSKDRSADLVRSYIAEHPDLHIVFRRNAVNKGWAQNYIDFDFYRKGAVSPRDLWRQFGDGLHDPRRAEAAWPCRYHNPVLRRSGAQALLSTRRVVGLWSALPEVVRSWI